MALGVLARREREDEADDIKQLVPIQNPRLAENEVQEVVQKFIEPGVVGTLTHVVMADETSGFVLLHVPAAEERVRRTKTDWKFYQRISAGTLQMEYYQIEEVWTASSA